MCHRSGRSDTINVLCTTSRRYDTALSSLSTTRYSAYYKLQSSPASPKNKGKKKSTSDVRPQARHDTETQKRGACAAQRLNRTTSVRPRSVQRASSARSANPRDKKTSSSSSPKCSHRDRTDDAGLSARTHSDGRECVTGMSGSTTSSGNIPYDTGRSGAAPTGTTASRSRSM